MSQPVPPREDELVAGGVDVAEWGPTEDDEQDVLGELYGEAGPDGVYRGEAR